MEGPSTDFSGQPTEERWDPLGAPNDQDEERRIDGSQFEFCDSQ